VGHGVGILKRSWGFGFRDKRNGLTSSIARQERVSRSLWEVDTCRASARPRGLTRCVSGMDEVVLRLEIGGLEYVSAAVLKRMDSYAGRTSMAVARSCLARSGVLFTETRWTGWFWADIVLVGSGTGEMCKSDVRSRISGIHEAANETQILWRDGKCF
jgi:hypothetical protein